MSEKDTGQSNVLSTQDICARIKTIARSDELIPYSPIFIIGTNFDIEPGNATHLQLSHSNGKKHCLQIPPPTKQDIRWAKKIVKKDLASKSYDFAEAAFDNNLWRLHFLLMQHIARPENSPPVIDMNAAQEIKNYHAFTPLAYSCIKGNSDATALLISFGADLNTSAENNRMRSPVYRCLHHSTLKCLKLLLDNKAKFYPDEFSKASHPEIKEYLSEKFGELLQLENIGFCDLNNVEKTKRALPKPKPEPENNTPNPSGTFWASVSEDIISRRDTAEKQFSLHTLFNFKACHILRFTESLDAQGNITHISPPSAPESFSPENKAEVREAHKKYTEKGGKLPLASAGQAPRQIQKRAR